MENASGEHRLPPTTVRLLNQQPYDIDLTMSPGLVLGGGQGIDLGFGSPEETPGRVWASLGDLEVRADEFERPRGTRPNVVTIDRGAPLFGRSLQLTVDRSNEFDIEIPLLRLHVPRFPGCTATYKSVDKTGGSWKSSFSVFGIGDGQLSVIEQEQMTEITAGPTCLEVLQPGRLRVETGKVLSGNRQMPLLGVVVTLIHVDRERMIWRDLEPAIDGCNLAPQAIESLKRVSSMNLLSTYDLRGLDSNSAPQQMSFKLTNKLELSTNLEPKLGDLAAYVSLSLTTTQKSEESLEIAYKLSPGAAYYPYKPAGAGSMEVCWTAVAAQSQP